ncbi:MAG: putative DNA binding domain-containing protein [Oscillospiraceae bacterium]|jgi:ATP-dependent DNA helicase RecG|nr:putative DNA binding domain-containing protein [Oscillospiraceae bacterium]
MRIENKNTEFKREYVEDIKKTVIAFANTDGGELLIGVDDDGTAVGLNDAQDVLLRTTNAIRDAIRPDVTLFAECVLTDMGGKRIVSVTVQRGTARPYYLEGEGVRPEGVFVRQGASSVPATETAILAMIKETGGDRYESARSLNQQLTFGHANTAFSQKDVAFGEPQKRTLHLIGEDGTYTNLALLLSEQCPHIIKLAVFEGVSKTVFKDRRTFGGSLFEQLEEVYGFVDRYNSLRSEFVGLNRIDKRDYPVEAIREALLNALVHRDYGLSPATLISIFGNRIEIVTIGGLMKGISLNDIMLGVSALRNPYLADVFYRLNLIEAYGTGIPKITEAYKNFAVQPTIELSDNAFKITLPNTNYRVESTLQLDGREEQVMKMFGSRDIITRVEVQEVLGISQATAIVLLRNMMHKGLLSTEGNGKKRRYKRG